jgi:hypothetical protein
VARSLLSAFLLLIAVFAAPAAVHAFPPPSWLVGHFAAFDPYSNRNVRLMVRNDGSAILRVSDRLGNHLFNRHGRFRPFNQIVLANEWYSVQRVGTSVRLTYISGNHRSWLFHRL